jgi:hypothetical protein
MLMNKQGYKGVEYGLTDRGNGSWGWVFYPAEGPPHRGEVTGDRENAEMACMRAINSWLASALTKVTASD